MILNDRRIKQLTHTFKSLVFENIETAYWRLQSGHTLVLMYEWHSRADGGIEWRSTYDVDIRGHGYIDLTQCPLYHLYDRSSFSNMSSDDVIKLAMWIENYVSNNEKAKQ